MKILFISQLFPYKKDELHTTGALREFIEEWAGLGNMVKVIRIHYGHEKEKFPQVPSFSIGENISVDFIQPIRIPVLKLSFYSLKKIIKTLDFKPDVMVCHHYNAYFTFYKLAKKLNIPLVAGIHMSDVRLAQKQIYHWYFKKIYHRVSGFACRSQSYQKQFVKLFPEQSFKTFLAMSGIPDKYLNQNTLKPESDTSVLHFITVSSLIARKQIDKILQALSELPQNITWQFSIIGEGAEKSKLQQLTERPGLRGKVVFLGNLHRDEVFGHLKKADIFVLPSYDETFGLVYLEAMAAGCLTIGSINEGIDGTIVNNQNGFLCDPFNEQSIKETLINAARLDIKEKERIINNALNTVSNYSNSKMAEYYLNQLKQIVNDYNKTEKRLG